MAARRPPPPDWKHPLLLFSSASAESCLARDIASKGLETPVYYHPSRPWFFFCISVCKTRLCCQMLQNDLQVPNHFLSSENCCAAASCSRFVHHSENQTRPFWADLCWTGGSVWEGRWKTLDMVEARMGVCWSCIQVTHLKSEKLPYDHKGILVSVLHWWKTLTVLQQAFYLTIEVQISHLIQPLNSCI